MRKQLMAGTALVAATMLAAGGAAAQDKKMMKPSISVNGYYEATVGGILDESQETDGVDMATDTSSLDARTDAEVHFNGRGALDNGLKIHARWELEAQSNGGDWVDEYFLAVSGAFGRVILGGTSGAPVKMLHGMTADWATQVGELLTFDVNDWVPSAAGRANFHTLQHGRLDTGDADKITYISPKFGGFQVGGTYSGNMENNDSNARVDAENKAHDGWEGAASYSGKFGDVGFAVGAGMFQYQGGNNSATSQDLSAWAVTGRLDFGGGFRVAATHKSTTNEDKATRGALTMLGVRFVQGPNRFSLTGSLGEMENNDAEHTSIMGSYARVLGPGVTWHANLIHLESKNADSTQENRGLVGVSGIKVVF